MSPTRRDFLKYTGATGVVLASSDLVADLLAQSPKANPLTSMFKGLADVALAEAKRLGCSYAAEDKQQFVQKVVDAAMKVKGVSLVTASVGVNNEWKYFASSEGSYIEQETFEITPQFNVSAKVGDVTKTRTFVAVPKTGGWEVAEESEMLENAERIANEAVEMTTAKPVGLGIKDLLLTPSHAMLTIHEIVAHAT